MLPTKAATALALAVNELVSNAVKHGHPPERRRGEDEVRVRLSKHDRDVLLEVEDRGPGFPAHFDALAFAHIGLELVHSLVEIDLQGSLTFGNVAAPAVHVRCGGGRVTVRFPEEPLSE